MNISNISWSVHTRRELKLKNVVDSANFFHYFNSTLHNINIALVHSRLSTSHFQFLHLPWKVSSFFLCVDGEKKIEFQFQNDLNNVNIGKTSISSNFISCDLNFSIRHSFPCLVSTSKTFQKNKKKINRKKNRQEDLKLQKYKDIQLEIETDKLFLNFLK